MNGCFIIKVGVWESKGFYVCLIGFWGWWRLGAQGQGDDQIRIDIVWNVDTKHKVIVPMVSKTQLILFSPDNKTCEYLLNYLLFQ